jgi:HEAT repeat protein
MPVTMQQVLAVIDKDEPDYTRAAQLGPDALTHLQQIVDADDPLRASKAAYTASLIPGPGSVELLRKAAEHPDPQIRVAVAHALRNMADAASASLLTRLLEDQDPGVRKVTLGTVGELGRPELRDQVTQIAEQDPEDFLRHMAAETVPRLQR